MKKIFLTCCLICLFTYAFAEKQPSLLDTNEITVKFGKILSNDIQNELVMDKNFYNFDSNSGGITIKTEYLYYFASYTGCGIGLSYTNNIANNFDPITPYIMIKQMCPMETNNTDSEIYLYMGGALGYGITSKTKGDIYSIDGYRVHYNGGLFWSIFTGIDINSFIFDLSLTQNIFKTSYAFFDNINDTYYSSKNNITYTTLSLSVGYKFNFKL